MTRPVLVIGRKGQLSRALVERAAARGVPVIAQGRPQLDLTDAASVERAVTEISPSIIVNTAAYTAVDKAESESDLAYAVNHEGAERIAFAAARAGVPIVHISTDYVFDGVKKTPWHESDPTAPLGVYGASKLAGEQATLDANDKAIVLRTAWLYSPFAANFVSTMLRSAASCKKLRVVDDQHGNPTSALDLAGAILSMADRWAVDRQAVPTGIFHAVGCDSTTWYGFAQEIFACSAAVGGPATEITPVSTFDYPTPARRPANSVLHTDKFAAIYGQRLPGFRTSLRRVVLRLLNEINQQGTL